MENRLMRCMENVAIHKDATMEKVLGISRTHNHFNIVSVADSAIKEKRIHQMDNTNRCCSLTTSIVPLTEASHNASAITVCCFYVYNPSIRHCGDGFYACVYTIHILYFIHMLNIFCNTYSVCM